MISTQSLSLLIYFIFFFKRKDNIANKQETLVYADLGPLSFERSRRARVLTLDVEGHRVEYAQLNYNASHKNELSCDPLRKENPIDNLHIGTFHHL